MRHVNRKTKIMEIWINPNCSTCHSALTLLDAEGARYTLRHHLEAPPTALEIEDILRRLSLEPWDIARVGESGAVELGLATWPREETDRTRWIDALAAHPMLIQRPIITPDDETTLVGRSPPRSSPPNAASNAQPRPIARHVKPPRPPRPSHRSNHRSYGASEMRIATLVHSRERSDSHTREA